MDNNAYQDLKNAWMSHARGDVQSHLDRLCRGQKLGPASPGRRLTAAERQRVIEEMQRAGRLGDGRRESRQ